MQNPKISIAEVTRVEYAIVMQNIRINSLLSCAALVATFLMSYTSTFVSAEMLDNGSGAIVSQPQITVTTSKPAGRYAGPIRVELRASNPEAKIWYTCRRNGTPADLIRYTEIIILSKSCALIYFGYVNTELESNIERTDYTILYSDNIELETRNQLLSLVNTGDTTVDI